MFRILWTMVIYGKMRIRHRYLNFDSNLESIGPVKTILDKYSHPYKYKERPDCVIPSFTHTIEFYLYEDNPEFSIIKDEVSRFLSPQVIGTEYEKVDIKNAEWFIASVGEYQYPQPEDDFGYLEATFNLEKYCHSCGVGKVQNAPYRLKTVPKQPKNQFWGLYWAYEAIFVREEAKNILVNEEINGIRFSNPVIHKTNVPIEGYYQLHIDNTLRGGFDNYNTKLITCKFDNEEGLNTNSSSKCCGRIKFHHPMIGGYLFDKSIFDRNVDIVNSGEYFGSGGRANRLQIVSRRFKDLVEINKLKGLHFTPIMHKKLER